MSNQALSLQSFYHHVEQDGRMRTTSHAERWTEAVLRTMGFNLTGGTKRELAKALPDELAAQLKRGWKLINLHNPRLTQPEFLKQVALRSGNTDEEYARMATTAVFRHLKQYTDADLQREVARSLPRDVGQLWTEA